MLEQFDHIETKNLGWLLLRSFVASPHLANSARCLGLKGIHFDRVGFDWWVDDLLKGLFAEGRRNIARLRQELPDLFDVLDRGGPIITSDDTVRALTKWFIDEAHYLDDARDLGLCDCIDIADRNRRRDVEACLRYSLEDFAKLLLPDGKRRDGLGNSRSTVHRNWDAQHETLGWVSVRVAGGKHKDWSISAGGKYVFGWSQALLVQIVLKRDLPQALDWIEAYLDRTDEQPTKPLPEVITRILSRASDQPPHTVTASKPAGAVDVIERPAERPALAAPPPPAPPSPAPAEIEEQASLPLDRAAPADIEAQNFAAALDLVPSAALPPTIQEEAAPPEQPKMAEEPPPVAPAAGAIVADVDDRPIHINAPDAEDEDESLLHSLDTPDPDSLPRVTAEALQEKRRLVIEGMKADRACLAARPASKPVEPDADLNQPAVHNDADAPTTSQNLSAALKHAGAGFAVFLCDQHKKPRGKWRDISTTDPETIRLWFQTWPDSIVGIDLAKSGLIVVDADRHDPEHDGVDALARLESENEPFENHPIIWTPRNGFHHVFRQPPGIPLGNATGALPKGIDIRGAGGFVIACGSISTVFGEWVAADGSLIEAFRAGTIPTLPDWLAAIIQTRPTKVQPSDNVVPFKPRDPKEEVPKEPGAAPRPPSSPTSRQKKRAAVALQGNAAELATTQPGNRNNRLNVLSYRMGRFVALGSITRQHVIEAFTAGCEANGLIQDDGIDSVMRTIKSGLDAGMEKPLEDIAAKSSEKRQGRNPYEREVQRSEVMALFRLRFGPHASYEAVDDVLAKIDSDDKEVIGRELGFTFEQYKRMGVEPLGRRRAKHPSTIKPFNATDDEIQAHLKECEKSRNSAAHKKQRAKLAEARKAVEDLDDRSSAVLTFLQHSAGPQSIAQIAAGIRKSRAFADLTDNALRRTILRLVTPPSKLAEMVVLTEGKTKNGRKTFFVGVRK